jgi:putative hydrolase of the HAD superfamily
MIITHPTTLPQKTYDTIILDLGSVLINVDPNIIATILGNHIYTLSPENCRRMFISMPFKRCAAGIITPDKAINELYTYFPKRQVDIFKTLSFTRAFQPLPKGQELFNLARKRASRVYILTNITPDQFKHIQENTPFIKEADGYTTSFGAKSRKPDPGIYQTLINHYTITPKTTLFFDDLENNCKAAASFGIDSVVCDYREDILSFFAALDVTNVG